MFVSYKVLLLLLNETVVLNIIILEDFKSLLSSHGTLFVSNMVINKPEKKYIQV